MQKKGDEQDSASFNASIAAVSHNPGRLSPAHWGASYAFVHAPNSTTPPSNASSGSNGALAAASFVGLGERREALEARRNEGPQAHQNGVGITRPSLYSQTYRGSMRESTSSSTTSFRGGSPSHVAARLAASRAPPPVEDVIYSGASYRPSPIPYNNQGEPSNGSSALSKTSMPDARSLVQLYESKRTVTPQSSSSTSIRYANRIPPPIASPKPIRLLGPADSSAKVLSAIRPEAPSTAQERTTLKKPSLSRNDTIAAVAKLVEPTPEANATSNRLIPEPPPPRRSRRILDESTDTKAGIPSNDYSIRGSDVLRSDMETVSSPSRANSKAPPVPMRQSDRETFTDLPSASQKPPAIYAFMNHAESREAAKPTRPSQEITRTSDTYVPQLSVDSLANAMVASSLASSRAPSPAKSPALPPRRHSKPHLFHRNRSEELMSRTPSPAKGMRQTMREAQKSDEEVQQNKRMHLVRKHANKHHEGDRKRYRTQVTERERQRYEGVWAANRGLLMDDDASHNTVLNIVVRDIWRRSRLPYDVLEEVWDLVNRRDLDRLGREEFVVGMWLIDQRLKGNKLPVKVPESVWSSVRRLIGIQLPGARR